ncbi:MAG TPA: hypothetical protein VH418_18735 [Solirubrobacteraceae bacterium]|jgi:hypothetical protein
MRRTLALLSLGSALAAPAALAPASAGAHASHCRAGVTYLPDLGYGGEADAIQARTVVGSVNDASGRQLPALWRDGRLKLLGPSDGFAGDVNRRGEVVGVAGRFTEGFAYVHGSLHLLQPHDGSFVYVRRVNDRGQIAGATGGLAARWDSSAASPTLLSPAGGLPGSFAKGINERGVVAGDSDAANGAPFSTLWYPDGRSRTLPSGFGPGEPSELFEINDRGEAVGESYKAGADGFPIADQGTVWSPAGQPRLIPLLPGTEVSHTFNVNDRGVVVGVAVHVDFAAQAELGHHAFVWSGRGPARTLPVPGRSYAGSQSNAHDIDARGTAVGFSGADPGVGRATVWTCAWRQAYVPQETTP